MGTVITESYVLNSKSSACAHGNSKAGAASSGDTLRVVFLRTSTSGKPVRQSVKYFTRGRVRRAAREASPSTEWMERARTMLSALLMLPRAPGSGSRQEPGSAGPESAEGNANGLASGAVAD